MECPFLSLSILDVNKQHTEFGIDPDTAVAITGEDIIKGRDTIIEAAIGLLLAKGIRPSHTKLA